MEAGWATLIPLREKTCERLNPYLCVQQRDLGLSLDQPCLLLLYLCDQQWHRLRFCNLIIIMIPFPNTEKTKIPLKSNAWKGSSTKCWIHILFSNHEILAILFANIVGWIHICVRSSGLILFVVPPLAPYKNRRLPGSILSWKTRSSDICSPRHRATPPMSISAHPIRAWPG